MDLDPKTKKALVKIDFLVRYKSLYLRHSKDDFFTNTDISKVLEIIKVCGYEDVKYFKSESFFSVEDFKKSKIGVGLNLSVKYGLVELILNVKIHDKIDGGPFGFIINLLGSEERIEDPRFSTYEELREILNEAFVIYEDFKKELIKNL
jgi:hypothetical protein